MTAGRASSRVFAIAPHSAGSAGQADVDRIATRTIDGLSQMLPVVDGRRSPAAALVRRIGRDPSDLACSLVVLAIAVPVLAAIAITTIRLLATKYPAIGWASTVNADAEAIFLGHWPYVDPATGYAAEAYT